jgi:hypothetical protein
MRRVETWTFGLALLSLSAWLTPACGGSEDGGGGKSGSGATSAAGGVGGSAATGGSGGLGGSAGGGSGGDAGCTAGATQACYSGPAGTQGVGVCTAGQATCGADGTWGACSGEKLPTPELCKTPEDEDCNGTLSCAAWQHAYGGANGSATLTGLAVGADGHAVVVGSFTGSVDFGNGPVSPQNPGDGFIAKYDVSGKLVWLKQLVRGGPSSVALAPNGDVVLAGTAQDQVDFGGGPFCQAGYGCSFFMKLGAATGAYVKLGQISTAGYTRVAVDPQGNIFVFQPAGVEKYDGQTFQSLKLVTLTAQFWQVGGMAFDAAGNLAIVGSFSDKLTYVANNTVVTLVANATDTFVSSFDPSLEPRWVRAIGGAGEDQAFAVALTSNGDLVVAGKFEQSVDFGGATLDSAGLGDGFVARFSGANGDTTWSKRFGGSEDDALSGIGVDAADDIALAGWFRADADFEGTQLASAGDDDVLVAKLDSTSKPIWLRAFGDSTAQRAIAAGMDTAGDVWFIGHNAGTIDFGLGAVSGDFLAQLPNP